MTQSVAASEDLRIGAAGWCLLQQTRSPFVVIRVNKDTGTAQVYCFINAATITIPLDPKRGGINCHVRKTLRLADRDDLATIVDFVDEKEHRMRCTCEGTANRGDRSVLEAELEEFCRYAKELPLSG